MQKLGDVINEIISDEPRLADIAKELYKYDDIFFIGRGIDSFIVTEASLKLKEISYIHSEAYAAGELKHGTISLITEDTPVAALATVPELYEKTRSNICEVATRGGKVFLVCGPDYPADSSILYEYRLPEINRLFMGIAAATAYQLFAYHVAVLRGCDIDKPRNLAKSVTVE